MEFKDQYNHPKWQEKRLRILERDGFKCVTKNCNSENSILHVHHLIYHKDHLIWEYEDNELTTYCKGCHNEWHKLKREADIAYAMPYIKVIKQVNNILMSLKGFDNVQISQISAIIDTIKKIENKEV